MRKYYLDNLRTIMILLLFPVHTFMIWNDFGTKFYVWGGESRLLSAMITLVNPWFMPVLFVVAGMCAKYSLEKRSKRDFIKERFEKLLHPFLSGMILLVPIQTQYARKFFFGFDGTILENLGYFFTHITNLSGYDGGLTPGQLWFILFLFIISLLSLAIEKYVPLEKIAAKAGKNIRGVILLFLPVWLGYYVGNFGGFSLGKNLVLYLIGYYIFSREDVIEKIVGNRKLTLTLFVSLQTILTLAYYFYGYYGDFLVNLTGWLGVLSCFAVGKSWLNRETKVTIFFRKRSFGIYMLHQSILVALGYYVLRMTDHLVLQVLSIMLGSFLLSLLAWEIFSRIPYVRKMLGIR